MILSGKKIAEEQGTGIKITPFYESQVNSNSYNLRLSNELAYYEDDVLDMKKKPTLKSIQIPEEGYLLEPGKLYFGRTVEYTETDKYVPMLEGRSSIGRLGLYIHVTAGFGVVGFFCLCTIEMYILHHNSYTPNVII